MRITGLKTLRCGAGFRDFCFVKLTTDGEMADGKEIIGWSEYLEERNIGVTQVIEWMGELVTGEDPLPFGKLISQLKSNTRHIVGGIANQAIAAIENALLDIVGKAYGVPVCALFGGPIRTAVEVYWSHAGSFRVGFHKHLVREKTKKPVPRLTSIQGCRDMAREVKEAGYKGLKTNIFHFDDNDESNPAMYQPGFGGGIGSPELNISHCIVTRLIEQMRAFREGGGPDMALRLDLNYNFKTDGFIKIAKALSPKAIDDDENGPGLEWLELDTYSAEALRQIRDAAAMPIASLESLMGRKAILPFLQAGSVDVAIIDPLWNGVAESIKMAELCETYEVNCAAHNYHGWLGTIISAHFCAAIPNFKILEVDVDDVPWKDDIVTVVPTVENSMLSLPLGPGWGIEVNEEELSKYPPMKDNAKSGIWSSAAEPESDAT